MFSKLTKVTILVSNNQKIYFGGYFPCECEMVSWPSLWWLFVKKAHYGCKVQWHLLTVKSTITNFFHPSKRCFSETRSYFCVNLPWNLCMLASVLLLLHNPGCGRCSSEKEQTSREIRHRMESQVNGIKHFFIGWKSIALSLSCLIMVKGRNSAQNCISGLSNLFCYSWLCSTHSLWCVLCLFLLW